MSNKDKPGANPFLTGFVRSCLCHVVSARPPGIPTSCTAGWQRASQRDARPPPSPPSPSWSSPCLHLDKRMIDRLKIIRKCFFPTCSFYHDISKHVTYLKKKINLFFQYDHRLLRQPGNKKNPKKQTNKQKNQSKNSIDL